MCHLTSLAVRSGLEVGVLRVVGRAALAAGARRRRSCGGLLAAALGAAAMVAGAPVAFRLERAGHQLPVDDRVHVAAAFDWRINGDALKRVKSFRLFSH